MSKGISILALAQVLLASRVFYRMARTAGGRRVQRSDHPAGSEERVTVLVPVLNEAHRLGPCLQGLVTQELELAEILVIDGGSIDGTQDLIRDWEARDNRVRLIDAAPVPDGVNGKAYGLQVGLEHSTSGTFWLLTIDADVRPEQALVRSLLAHASAERLQALSIATRQHISGAAEGMLHPAMLATLVYRFGIPGIATQRVDRVQANGQCFLVNRATIEAVGGFSSVMSSVCEDVTLARAIAARGVPVGFYETDSLVSVEMYAGWRDAWHNWTRSLPMRDRYCRRASDLGLLEVALVQAAPIWLLPLSRWRYGSRHPLTLLNIALVWARIGVLTGMARAYVERPWTYWCSPLLDVPVVLRVLWMSRRSKYLWRGRVIDSGVSP